MSQVRWLRAQDYPRMPWKNGGGFTAEIARDCEGGFEGFGWRLSIADIEASGGFSRFVGCQRIITVLEGDGMQLKVDNQASRPLLALDAFAFSGQSEVSCQLLGGPIRDFNLIYQPDRFAARLQWFEGRTHLFSSAATVLVFAADEQVEVQCEGAHAHALQRYDCLHITPIPALVQLQVQGRCCVIELTPRR
ncbi:HutD family protein [Pseudomonas sp. RP23018S]|uniref:HutD/Ves family protein n=1 Tax=Pseudomonas sp. RP23018S TaxID=3096037 RepID=UPI002ACADD99|nr:HutD family protein [Pseudomonas sp. RP23018S]MDZ5604141.1 HutD family protein [Pseudomonas sp. RP23018S]